jgi:hypothetical protein
MHMTIGLIVYAKTKQDAINQAQNNLENLTGDGGAFDYGEVYPKEAAKAASRAGKKLIADCWKNTKADFMDHMAKIRRCIALYTDEELMEQRPSGGQPKDMDLTLARHHMRQVGEHRGPAVWLYNDNGEGIRTEGNLKNTLDKYACLYEDRGCVNPKAALDVWIIPVCVHY